MLRMKQKTREQNQVKRVLFLTENGKTFSIWSTTTIQTTKATNGQQRRRRSEILFNLSLEQRVWPLNGWNETESGVRFFVFHSLTTRDKFVFIIFIFYLSCIIVCKKWAFFLSIDQVFGVFLFRQAAGWLNKKEYERKTQGTNFLFGFEKEVGVGFVFVWLELLFVFCLKAFFFFFVSFFWDHVLIVKTKPICKARLSWVEMFVFCLFVFFCGWKFDWSFMKAMNESNGTIWDL